MGGVLLVGLAGVGAAVAAAVNVFVAGSLEGHLVGGVVAGAPMVVDILVAEAGYVGGTALEDHAVVVGGTARLAHVGVVLAVGGGHTVALLDGVDFTALVADSGPAFGAAVASEGDALSGEASEVVVAH